MQLDLDRLVRENIKSLVPYSSARGEFGGGARVFLDANENAFGSPLAVDHSRYPDPMQAALKATIARNISVLPTQIFVGNGSDEAIDLLFRIFCRPQLDNVLICPPTYGVYETSAGINDVTVRRANLTAAFELDPKAVRICADENSKLIFICSPNNPTGNLLDRTTILDIAGSFAGIVVVDEAYIHFSHGDSLVSEIGRYPNLVILQTFSKAWGLAGLRVGMACADASIIDLFNKVKPPYNVSRISQELVLAAHETWPIAASNIDRIADGRKELANRLLDLPSVERVYPSDANFVLVKIANATHVYNFLMDEGIVVRNRGNVVLCKDCLRITIGTADENQALLIALGEYEQSIIY